MTDWELAWVWAPGTCTFGPCVAAIDSFEIVEDPGYGGTIENVRDARIGTEPVLESAGTSSTARTARRTASSSRGGPIHVAGLGLFWSGRRFEDWPEASAQSDAMPGYLCQECGAVHDEIAMSYWLPFPEEAYAPGSVHYERDGELCVVGDDRFILANIELPVAGEPEERFVWTAWFSLSRASYDRFQASWEMQGRERQPPAFAWLWSPIPSYEPTTHELRANVHPREVGVRPWVEIEPTSHPLAVEQQRGITRARIDAIFHGLPGAGA